MKIKNFLRFAVAGVLALSFTACEEDEDSLGAFLTVTETTSGSTGGATTITQGNSLVFIWDARKGDSDMDTYSVSVSGVNTPNPIPQSLQGNDFPYDIKNADDETYIDTLIFPSAGNNLGVTSYTFTVTDKDGNTDAVTFTVTVESGATALSSPAAFTWERIGGAAATGLSMFGLKWTSNSATSAIVAIDGTTTMVELTVADWNNISSQEDLATAIAAGTTVPDYRGVSSTQDDSYTDVLGVTYNGSNYIINIQNGTVTTGGAGTTITITGEYKN